MVRLFYNIRTKDGTYFTQYYGPLRDYYSALSKAISLANRPGFVGAWAIDEQGKIIMRF